MAEGPTTGHAAPAQALPAAAGWSLQRRLGRQLLALLAVGLGLLWPPAYRLTRLAHLHLNTLGFIGLSAVGTLHVLIPTALGRPDPLAAQRLLRQLPWMLAGVGAAALAGGLPAAVLLGGVVAATLVGWVRTHGLGRLFGDGVATSLLMATTGLLGLILAGLAHGLGAMPGRPAVAGFFALFLLPLVTGALSQLLPVWRFPGPLTPARTQLRERLALTRVLRDLIREPEVFDQWFRTPLERIVRQTIEGGSEQQTGEQRRFVPADLDPPESYTPDGSRRTVQAALQQLTALERSVFVLRHLEQRSLHEIAQTLSSNVNACKQAIFRAVRKLRAHLAHFEASVS